jgi:hypothetical protein
VTSPHFDLVVRGATLVMPGHGEQAAIGVRDGPALAKLGRERGVHEVNVRVDAAGDHEEAVGAEFFVACHRAAELGYPARMGGRFLDRAADGITAVGNMTFALLGESMTTAVGREMAEGQVSTAPGSRPGCAGVSRTEYQPGLGGIAAHQVGSGRLSTE